MSSVCEANEHLNPHLFDPQTSPRPDSVRGGLSQARSLEEVVMFQIQAPILIVPTAQAQQALGGRLRSAGLAAYREIAVAAKGLEIACLRSPSSS